MLVSIGTLQLEVKENLEDLKVVGYGKGKLVWDNKFPCSSGPSKVEYIKSRTRVIRQFPLSISQKNSIQEELKKKYMAFQSLLVNGEIPIYYTNSFALTFGSDFKAFEGISAYDYYYFYFHVVTDLGSHFLKYIPRNKQVSGQDVTRFIVPALKEQLQISAERKAKWGRYGEVLERQKASLKMEIIERDEDVATPYAVVKISDGVETDIFTCKNTSKFGYIIMLNGKAAITSTRNGKSFWVLVALGGDKKLGKIRELSSFEKKAVSFLEKNSPISTVSFKM